ncbi:MAG: hypothetical protein XE08_0274, partial [Parcubacteria bacterium 32_520]
MIIQGLKIALESLWANKMRSFLSMLGIVIGVGELANYMEEFCPSVSRVISTKQISGLFIYDDVNVNANLVGTEPYFREINNYQIGQGRFINDQDNQQRNQVIVLGSELVTDLFENDNPVGQKVKVNYQGRIFMFQVVGVMKEKGGSMAGNLDNQAYIPLTIAMDRMTNSNYISSYIAQATSSQKAPQAVKELENFMVKFLDDEDQEQFRIMSQDELLDTVSSVTNTMSMMLGGIAAISLLVGGIGIMNIMLVSVTERTREIGIRKALGARNKNILFQFLMESLSLSSLGGIAGIGFGWIAAYFLS